MKFGANSELTKALDNARKLKVAPTATSLPPKWTKTKSGAIISPAQKKGWFYSYNDETCNYGCQANEYLWQGYCTFSGLCDAFKDPKASFGEDMGGYKFQTKKAMQKGDPTLYGIFAK